MRFYHTCCGRKQDDIKGEPDVVAVDSAASVYNVIQCGINALMPERFALTG